MTGFAGGTGWGRWFFGLKTYKLKTFFLTEP
jgi:hypothetical protein